MIFLIGQRRVGKSYMLRQLHSWLEENRPGATVVYINKELQAFSNITNAEELYSYSSGKMPEPGENYLLIDEVQDIERYEDALRSFHAEGRCQIVATGSNAYVFSSELSTRLGGRYIEIPIYSLGYMEFLEFHRMEDSDKSLQLFLRAGGLPGLCHFDIDDEAQLRDYLQGVYNTIMMRDVIAREKIRNVPFIENLSRFIADNVGKLISVSSIAKFMKSHGGQVSEPLTSTYLNYLCKALLVSQVMRYDIHGKRIFELNSKYYYADHGLRNLICGFNLRGSIGKIIENVIYNHLRIQGFDVKVGILRAGEVDFVAVKGEQNIYVQAAYSWQLMKQ
ncbi:MAG: ATP-binding protein [Bacteroidales bacterium]|nr:ATP-binding protein [Bacteroidales bacterium]